MSTTQNDNPVRPSQDTGLARTRRNQRAYRLAASLALALCLAACVAVSPFQIACRDLGGEYGSRPLPGSTVPDMFTDYCTFPDGSGCYGQEFRSEKCFPPGFEVPLRPADVVIPPIPPDIFNNPPPVPTIAAP